MLPFRWKISLVFMSAFILTLLHVVHASSAARSLSLDRPPEDEKSILVVAWPSELLGESKGQEVSSVLLSPREEKQFNSFTLSAYRNVDLKRNVVEFSGVQSVTHNGSESFKDLWSDESKCTFGSNLTDTYSPILGAFQLTTKSNIKGVIVTLEIFNLESRQKYVNAVVDSLRILKSPNIDDQAAAETILAFHLQRHLQYRDPKKFFTPEYNFMVAYVKNDKIKQFWLPKDGKIDFPGALVLQRNGETLELTSKSPEDSENPIFQQFSIRDFPYVATSAFKVEPDYKYFIFSFGDNDYNVDVVIGALVDALAIIRAFKILGHESALNSGSDLRQINDVLLTLSETRLTGELRGDSGGAADCANRFLPELSEAEIRKALRAAESDMEVGLQLKRS